MMNAWNAPLVFDGGLLDIYSCKLQKSSTGLDVCVAKEYCRWAHSSSDGNGKYCSDPSISLMDISQCRVRVNNMGIAVCLGEDSSCRFSLACDEIRTCLHPLTTNPIATRLELDFGKIKSIRDDIAEIVINENIELTGKQVDKLHEAMLIQYKGPFSVLLDMTNRYSLSFCALTKFGAIAEIKNIAITVNNKAAETAAGMFHYVPREDKPNLKIFQSKPDALLWLTS